MVINPIMGGGNQKKYQVINDDLNIFYPTEAYPGQYVAKRGLAGGVYIMDESKTYFLSSVRFASDVSNVPPKVLEVIEGIPAMLVPPPTQEGYAWFVMPEQNVKISTY